MKNTNFSDYNTSINENYYFNPDHIKENPNAALALAAITAGPIIIPMFALCSINFVTTRNVKSSLIAGLKVGSIMTGLMTSIMVLSDIFDPKKRSARVYTEIIDSNHFAFDYMLSKLRSLANGRDI